MLLGNRATGRRCLYEERLCLRRAFGLSQNCAVLVTRLVLGFSLLFLIHLFDNLLRLLVP